jgi:dihydrofolate reductase
MRRVLFQMLTSLDGYFVGPHGELDWHIVDAEFQSYAEAVLRSVDLLLFGRVTYQLMADYWPSPDALTDDPVIARLMNDTPKIVFSRTLTKADWRNTRLVNGDAAAEVARLKQQPGRDLVIFGSSDLVVSLTHAELIDEYRIFVVPVILGSGKALLHGITERLKLRLLRTKMSASGVVMLVYERA